MFLCQYYSWPRYTTVIAMSIIKFYANLRQILILMQNTKSEEKCPTTHVLPVPVI